MKNLFRGERPLFLHAITFSKELRLLVLAPHPDDFDAMAITMRFFRDNGNPIYVAVISSGANGVEDGFCAPATPAVKAAIREEEQRNSCQFFGLPESHLAFLRLQEDHAGHPMETQENLQRVRECFVDKHPDMIFLPHANDTNTGHRRTYFMFQKIASEATWPIAAFLIRDPKTIDMRSDLYAVFGEEDAEWKGELLRFHRSQHQRNLNTRQHGFDDRILNVNREIVRDLSEGVKYAEAFELEFWEQEKVESLS